MMPAFKFLTTCLPVISKLIISFYLDISLSSVGTCFKRNVSLSNSSSLCFLACAEQDSDALSWEGGIIARSILGLAFFLTSPAQRALLLPEIILKCYLSHPTPFLDIRNFLFLLKIGFDNVLRGLTNRREKAEKKVESYPMELPCRGLGHCHLGEHGQKE